MLLDEPGRVGLADAENLVLIGDSAGGNLAACVSLLLRREEHRGASRQILRYPVTGDDHNPATSPFASVREHGTGHRLTAAEMQAYMDVYVPAGIGRAEERTSPLHAADPSGQPSTLVITAEEDLLRDEGEAYTDLLSSAGTAARARQGFIRLQRWARTLREAYAVIEEFFAENDHRAEGRA